MPENRRVTRSMMAKKSIKSKTTSSGSSTRMPLRNTSKRVRRSRWFQDEETSVPRITRKSRSLTLTTTTTTTTTTATIMPISVTVSIPVPLNDQQPMNQVETQQLAQIEPRLLQRLPELSGINIYLATGKVLVDVKPISSSSSLMLGSFFKIEGENDEPDTKDEIQQQQQEKGMLVTLLQNFDDYVEGPISNDIRSLLKTNRGDTLWVYAFPIELFLPTITTTTITPAQIALTTWDPCTMTQYTNQQFKTALREVVLELNYIWKKLSPSLQLILHQQLRLCSSATVEELQSFYLQLLFHVRPHQRWTSLPRLTMNPHHLSLLGPHLTTSS
jgi:hypothetical protein